ncbi:MAG: hypothetical protein AB1696_25140 [Planctomycetota bacterium]
MMQDEQKTRAPIRNNETPMDGAAQAQINALVNRLAALTAKVEQAAARLAALERAVDGMKGKVG